MDPADGLCVCVGLHPMSGGGPPAMWSLLKVPVDVIFMVIIIIIEYLCDCWWTVLAAAWQWERLTMTDSDALAAGPGRARFLTRL